MAEGTSKYQGKRATGRCVRMKKERLQLAAFAHPCFPFPAVLQVYRIVLVASKLGFLFIHRISFKRQQNMNSYCIQHAINSSANLNKIALSKLPLLACNMKAYSVCRKMDLLNRVLQVVVQLVMYSNIYIYTLFVCLIFFFQTWHLAEGNAGRQYS